MWTKFTQFPTTPNVPQPTFNGSFDDAFVTKLGAYKLPGIPGDVNDDGTVGAYDAALVLQYVVGLFNMVQDSPQWKAADVSDNGKVTAYDAALILQHSVGLITEFPVEKQGGAPALNPESESQLKRFLNLK